MSKIMNTNVQNLEQSVEVEEKPSPQDEYSNAIARNKKLSIIGTTFLVLCEIIIATVFMRAIVINNFHDRVLKENEIRRTGSIEFNNGTYLGETDFGYFFGNGAISFNSGSTYVGNFRDNQLEGLGRLNTPIEGSYEGIFSGSLKNGDGTFSWDDGSVYTGEWKADQMCGQGKYVGADGVTYSGIFKDNQFWEGDCLFTNGTGNYTITYILGDIDSANVTFTDGTTYSGECNADGLSGTGTMNFPNGDTYSGKFSKSSRTGRGTYFWSFGDSYDGDWHDDYMTGTGIYTFSDGNYADGIFENNLFLSGSYVIENDFGKYVFTFSNAEATAIDMVLESGTAYCGDIKDGALSGQAMIEYGNGDKYSGNVVDGKKSGNGQYSWTNGASYDGQWAEDYMEGSGTYFYSTGETGYKLSGTFSAGKPTGQCQYYLKAGESYKTDWSNGRCVKIYE